MYAPRPKLKDHVSELVLSFKFYVDSEESNSEGQAYTFVFTHWAMLLALQCLFSIQFCFGSKRKQLCHHGDDEFYVSNWLALELRCIITHYFECFYKMLWSEICIYGGGL